MILPVHERLRERLLATLQHLYQLPPDALPHLPIEYPPKRELGDLATPVAFELARRLRKAPRAIAQELAAALGAIEGIARVEAAPNGYLNIYLDRVALCATASQTLDRPRIWPQDQRPSTVEDDRRAHRHQSEQGRAHRPPSEFRARRHARARAAVPRRSGGSAELHRRHRRPGRRRRRGVPRTRAQEPRRDPAHRRLDALRLLLLGPVRPRHALVRRRQGAAEDPRGHTSRYRARRNRDIGCCRVHRRSHRPLPPADDGAAECGLRPADVGRAHSAAAVLGARLRDPEGERRGLSSDRGQARRMLGDAHRRRCA